MFRMIKRIAAVSLASLTVLLTVPGASVGAAESPTSPETVRNIWDMPSYREWIADYANAARPEREVVLGVGDAQSAGLATEEIDGEPVIRIGEDGSLSWDFGIDETGLYAVKIIYSPVGGDAGYSSDVECTLAVNGEIPYQECSYLDLPQFCADTSDTFKTDQNGDEVQPAQSIVQRLSASYLRDAAGYISEALSVYLTEGGNTVELACTRGEMYVAALVFTQEESLPSYSEYVRQYEDADASAAASVTVEAERVYEKSHSTISLVSDRTSAETSPQSYRNFLLNSIGGSAWSRCGQWISWKITAPRTGLYTLTLRCKQDVTSGTVSARRLYIDGAVPFKEAENFTVAYQNGWQNVTLSVDGSPCVFYLEEGEHELRLEVVLGDMAEILEQVSIINEALSDDYIRILAYTGASPDPYKDYGFETLMPDVLADMVAQYTTINGIVGQLREMSDTGGQSTSVLEEMSSLLKKMTDDTDQVATCFSTFNDCLSALGTWLTTYTAQPLLIDRITLAAPGGEAESRESFFKNLLYKVRIFLTTFSADYQASAGEDGRMLTVWTAAGRDQNEILQRLTAEGFTQETGIPVNVQLVAANALLPNILAGTQIDVFIGAAVSTPLNYAIRGAVVDLTQFEDYEEISGRFNPAAMIPFTYRGAVYALPETLDFPLLFYRADIFSNLGLSVPETWDDFYETIALLQQNNMTVGIEWTNAFALMLYQSGGSYYNADFTASALDSETALKAFRRASDLYTVYGLPYEFSFANRFRSGEMPMGIMNYPVYNELSLFAPEIKGLWKMASVPATVREDGSICRDSVSTGTASMMLSTTGDKLLAWEFLKWWTSSETQSEYGIRLELQIGGSARQSSANLDVVRKLPWSSEEYAVLERQWNALTGIPEIPGSYYLTRTLSFAFNSVYSLGEDPDTVLFENAEELNSEITRKLKEFSLLEQ